jgi:tripeptide aminopeptidase
MVSPPMPTLNEAAAVALILKLLAIPGRSREEARIQDTIKNELLSFGIAESAIQFDTAHQRIPGGGEVGNLIVKLPGTKRGPRRLLMAHVDTVPICFGADPVVKGDRIISRSPTTGLGGDDRAGVGVILSSVREILQHNLPHPPLTLFFCVQEEIGLYGARYVSVPKLGKPTLCFNFDGGKPEDICIGATGDYAIDIVIHGHASHAGVHPELGVNAIAIAAAAITDLQANGWHGLIQKGKHTGTSNVGMIHGGEATNVVTPAVRLKAEARSHDPAFRKKIVAAYELAFTKAAKSIKSADAKIGRVEFTAELKYESFCLPTNAPVVESARRAVHATGLTSSLRISNGGLDANWMVAHGLPTVTLGCGQNAIHTVNEWLDIPSYLNGCRVAIGLATGADNAI